MIMKNIPKKIYLQIDSDGETPEDFNELHGVSWADERINDNDIEYVLVNAENECKKEVCKTQNHSKELEYCSYCGKSGCNGNCY
jgi:hypothetical protein